MADIYDDFNEFVAKLLKEVKERGGEDFDYWLGATTVAFGATTAAKLLPRLGLGAAAGTSLLATPLMPIVGALLAGGAGYLLAKYLSKAKTDRGMQVTANLEAAKRLYEEYSDRCSNGEIDDDRKKQLIDRLFAKLITGKDLI